MVDPPFSLQPASVSDILLAKIMADSFTLDRHTEMKSLGKVPYNLEEVSKSDTTRYLDSPECAVIKAVHNASGEIMGWSCRVSADPGQKTCLRCKGKTLSIKVTNTAVR